MNVRRLKSIKTLVIIYLCTWHLAPVYRWISPFISKVTGCGLQISAGIFANRFTG